MTETGSHVPADDETPVSASEGSEANASDPEAQSEDSELTVDDILAEEQTEDAKEADSADDENPYLEDLRRLTAEYANYRRRTEANREEEAVNVQAETIKPLLAVLDDLDRVEQHGGLEEGSAFALIAEKMRGVLKRMGLESYGEKDEPFDPAKHEAVAQVPVPGTEEQLVLDVVEKGYRLGEKEIRPAKVAVAVNPDG